MGAAVSLEHAVFRCARCRATRQVAVRPAWCGSCGHVNTYRYDADATAAHAAERVVRTPLRRVAPPVAAAPSDLGALVVPAEAPGGVVEAPVDAGWSWAADVEPEIVERARSGWAPWAAVVGELAEGKVTLVGGKRGTGKTRALLRVCAGIVRTERRPALYASGENDPSELAGWIAEMHRDVPMADALRPGGLALSTFDTLEQIEALVTALRPAVVVVDSFGTLSAGGVAVEQMARDEQKRVVARLKAMGAAVCAAVVVVMHMRADGAMAGGSKPQQMADVVVVFEPHETVKSHVRLRIDDKNRYGPKDVEAWLTFTPHGALRALDGE